RGYCGGRRSRPTRHASHAATFARWYLVERAVSAYSRRSVVPGQRPHRACGKTHCHLELFWHFIAALSFHRRIYFSAPLDCAASRTFLYFLPCLLHFLRVPLQRQIELIRLDDLLVERRCSSSASCSFCPFRARFSGAPRP